MADQFQIPQRNPQFVAPVAPPYELINASLNRTQQNAQAIPSAISAAVDAYYKKKQLQAGAYEAGGSRLLNMLYGIGNSPGQQQPLQGKDPNQDPSVAGTPSGASPANVGAPPQQTFSPQSAGPQQSLANPPSPFQQQGGQSPAPSPQDWQPGQPMMHPTSGLPQTIHDHAENNPDYAGQLQSIQNSMSGYNDSGAYGRTQQQGLANQATVVSGLLNNQREGKQFETNQNRQTDQFNQSQAAEESRFQRGQEFSKNKEVAAVTNSSGDTTLEITGVQRMFDNIDKNLKAYYSGPHYIGSANLAAASGGRMGSTAGSLVQKQAVPMVASINRLLTRRFNMGENELLNDNIAPSTNYTPQYNASIMAQLHDLVKTAATGNRQKVLDVISALNGKVPDMGAANGQK